LSDLLTVENLQIAIRMHGHSVPVVKGVSFRVPRGKTVALVGESGSGKTIIAKSLLGILPKVASITGGSIRFRDPLAPETSVDIGGLDTEGRAIHALRGGRIAMVFQEPMSSFSPLHTIGNQIQEALTLHREVSLRDARKTTEDMLALAGFGQPQRAYDSYPMELSGGMLQRAMIAMAIICNPALLIADEPTTALDVVVQAQILSLLKDIQQKLDTALLLITHDLGVVANMADELIVVYRGAVVEAGTRERLFLEPKHPYLKALLNAVPKLGASGDKKLIPLREIEHTVARTPATEHHLRRAAEREPILSVNNLIKSFKSRKPAGFLRVAEDSIRAVNDVSFDVLSGECFGIVGESGSGKSTLIRTIMRAVSADSGSVIYHGADGDIDLMSMEGDALRVVRPRMQMVFQDPFGSLSPRSTILNTLLEPLEIHGIGNPASRRERAKELMRLVGLRPDHLNRYPHSFSGGQRQRIGIARALALEPDMLVCDEAVSALDVSVQAQVLNLLKHLQKELGLTIIFISHNLAVVNYIADRIAVMRRGRIVELAPRRKVFTEAAHPYTRQLLAAIPTTDLDNPLDLSVSSNAGTQDSIAGEWANGDATGMDAQPVEISDGHFVWRDVHQQMVEQA
jgi:peptide/nickel transport system ATP-binding protein